MNLTRLYKTLIEHMNEAVWMGDKDENTLYVNPQFCKMTGFTPEDLKNKKSYDFCDEETVQRMKHINEVDRKQRSIGSSYEGKIVRRNGQKIPVLVSGSPIEGGGTMAIITDLTELKNKEFFFHEIIEKMGEPIVIVDKDKKILFVNKKYCELSGYQKEELLRNTGENLWTSESLKRIRYHEDLRLKGLTTSYEGTMISKSGEHIPTLISGSPLENGASLGIIFDIRQHKKQEFLYQMLLEHMNEGVIVTDKNGKALFANPKFCQMMECSKETILGKSSIEFYDEESAKKIEYTNEHERKEGVRSSYEATMVSKSQKRIPVLISGSPLIDGGTIAIISDLSELKKRESLYKKLIENMNEAVWMGDKNEQTIYANPKLCQLIGYRFEELIGRKAYDFWAQETGERIRYINVTDRKKGISSSYEGSLLTKEGKKIPVLVNGTPLPEGGTMGIITDLSELKKKESLYKNLIENMNEAVWMGDKDERTVYVNPKFCELMGYSLDQMIGKESYEFWDKESSERVRHINIHHRKKGLSSSYEGNLITKSKKKIPVLVNGTPLADGGTIGIITDLRELKEKEKKEKILNTAIEYSTDAMLTFNKKGKVQSWNKGAKIMFGYKKEEMIGTTLEKIFDPQTIKDFIEKAEVKYNFEIIGHHKNKTPLTISATLTPIINEGEKTPSFYLLIARDVTHHIKVEEELTLKYQKIKEAYNQFGIIRRQMDYLFELLDLASHQHDKKSIADFIVSSVIMLTRVDACILRTYNKQKKTLEMLSSFGVDEDWRGKVSIKYDNSLVKKAYQKHLPLKIIDVTKEARYQSPYLAKKMNFSSLLLIPLSYQGELIGSLSLYATPEKKLQIFENEFIEKYAQLIEIILGTVLKTMNAPANLKGTIEH